MAIGSRPVAPAWAWLATAAALVWLQVTAVAVLELDGGEGALRRAIIVVSTALFAVLALRFRRYAGAWVVAAGIVLNLLPMSLHGGLMPVSYERVLDSGEFGFVSESQLGMALPRSKDVLLSEDDIHFAMLVDRHLVSLPGYGTHLVSLGDFVVVGGLALVVCQLGLEACGLDGRGLRRMALAARGAGR